MTYFNPLIAPLAGSPQAQRTAAAEKERAARAQALAKNTAAEGDRYEHQVESPEGLTPVGEDPSRGGSSNPQQHPPKKQSVPAPEGPAESHIDVTG